MKKWLLVLGMLLFLSGCGSNAPTSKEEKVPSDSVDLLKEGLKGKVKEVMITTEENGKAMRVEIVSFSPKGEKVRTIYRNQNEPEKVITYDGKGRVKSQEEVGVEKIEFKYDDHNNTFEALKNGNGFIAGKLDAKTKKISLRQESNLDYYFYFDEKGNEVSKETYQDNKMRMRVAISYDEKNREKLNEITLYWNEKEPVKSKREFIYKDDWLAEKKISSTSSHEPVLSFSYTYEDLDNKGNWQKRTTINNENKHQLVDIRQITYYE